MKKNTNAGNVGGVGKNQTVKTVYPVSNVNTSPTQDALTVLTTVSESILATKKFTFVDGKIHKDSYGRAASFTHHQMPVSDIHSLHMALQTLSTNTRSFVIRGAVVDPSQAVVKRRKHARDSEPAYICEQPHHWLHVDVDGVPLPDGLTDDDVRRDASAVVSAAVKQYLPSYLHDVTVSYQLSSSMLVTTENELRAHLWFWLEHPYSDTQLDNWAQRLKARANGVCPIDGSVYRTVQPNYTAAPIFEGIQDPCEGFRSGLIIGSADSTSIPESEIQPLTPPTPKRTRHFDDPNDVIKKFNDATMSAFVDLLERNGYRYAGRDGRNETFVSPLSQSGAAGVKVKPADEKYNAVVTSFGFNDYLPTNKALDFFEAFAILEHAGDKSAAYEAAARELGVWQDRIDNTKQPLKSPLQSHVDHYYEVDNSNLTEGLNDVFASIPHNANVLIQAGLGRGKTWWAKEYFKEHFQNPLITNHLQILSWQLASPDKFDGRCYLGMSYNDFRHRHDYVGTDVCTINSLTRYREAAKDGAGIPAFDGVLVDEIDACVHRLSDGDVTNAGSIFDTFRQIASKTQRIIGMSAYIDRATVEFLRGIDPKRPIVLIKDTHVPSTGMTFERLENAAHTLERANTMLAAGKRVVLPTNSDEFARATYKDLRKRYPDKRTLLVDSASKNEPRQRAFIANPNTECQKYDLIVYTPVLGAGFSVDAGHGFELVGHICALSTLSPDSMQLLHRFREMQHMAISIDSRREYLPTTLEGVQDMLTRTFQHDSDVLAFNDEGNLVIRDATFARVHAATLAAANSYKRDMRGSLLELLLASGRSEIDSDKATDNAKPALAQAQEASFDDYVNDVAKAPVLTSSEADTLSKRNDNSYQDYMALERFALLAFFGLQDDPLERDAVATIVRDDRRGKLRQQVNRLVLTGASDGLIQAMRTRELESFRRDALADGYPDAKRTPFALHRDYYQRLLDIANIDPTTLEQTRPYSLGDVTPKLEALAKDKQRYPSAKIPSAKNLLKNPLQWLGIQLRGFGITTQRTPDKTAYIATVPTELQTYVKKRRALVQKWLATPDVFTIKKNSRCGGGISPVPDARNAPKNVKNFTPEINPQTTPQNSPETTPKTPPKITPHFNISSIFARNRGQLKRKVTAAQYNTLERAYLEGKTAILWQAYETASPDVKGLLEPKRYEML